MIYTKDTQGRGKVSSSFDEARWLTRENPPCSSHSSLVAARNEKIQLVTRRGAAWRGAARRALGCYFTYLLFSRYYKISRIITELFSRILHVFSRLSFPSIDRTRHEIMTLTDSSRSSRSIRLSDRVIKSRIESRFRAKKTKETPDNPIIPIVGDRSTVGMETKRQLGTYGTSESTNAFRFRRSCEDTSSQPDGSSKPVSRELRNSVSDRQPKATRPARAERDRLKIVRVSDRDRTDTNRYDRAYTMNARTRER